MEWLIQKALKLALKELIVLGFFLCCFLAKIFPIFDDGNYKADAILYMLLGGLAYYMLDFAR